MNVDDFNDKQGDAFKSIPHLNGSLLLKNPNLRGKEVSIVGRALGQNDDQSINFKASDGQSIKISADYNSDLLDSRNKSKHFEVRGVVQSDGSIQTKSYQEFGNNFCAKTWNKFVVLSQGYPQLF